MSEHIRLNEEANEPLADISLESEDTHTLHEEAKHSRLLAHPTSHNTSISSLRISPENTGMSPMKLWVSDMVGGRTNVGKV